MTHFIFVTGGVVSSLGKGIAAASLGAILEARGLKVTMMKLDPYINVDPGTMSPFQHGEVFVTDDGAETDLDLGHYERFVRMTATRRNSVSAGRVYKTVIERERAGEYHGNTVQVIPHITNEIKDRIYRVAGESDIAIIEIGGTVGDIESLPFLEAIRQIRTEVGPRNSLFLHLTLVPYLKASGEVKTKPTQHSVKELRSIGIQPDILICRTEAPIPQDECRKIALFTSVAEEAVISCVDADSIYKIPRMLHDQSLDRIVLEQFNMTAPEADLSEWDQVLENIAAADSIANILIVGKYTELNDTYKSINEALFHAGIQTKTAVKLHYVEASSLETMDSAELDQVFANVDAVLIPGGFGERGIEGKIRAIQYVREHGIPYLGLCLGMQLAVVEYARNVLGLEGANTSEVDPTVAYPVIQMLDPQRDSETDEFKGYMTIGAQPATLQEGTKAFAAYGQADVSERHRHRYGVNLEYIDQLQDGNFVVSGRTKDRGLIDFIELKEHPWFVGTQSHPEFKSTPRDGHPLFIAFVEAAKAQQK
ncbi:CTP synthetase [Ignatzschineria ureiclastica]|uniref:CTP synthase n=1 Tax=Ignatzschineria ureiclastica TaxID=472582 RepID=A0A2U2AGK4_9GAMM|nr:CTP synthase [Ignatzschineria ureiclastica]PWD81719.1 CTP synthetase [Ignatzschineria ureiclastica]GGZ90091.1 CTP synthase [Ignatzschineria ureiclastica]